MIFRFSGVSFLALLAMLNGGDLYAGKGEKGELSENSIAAKTRREAATVTEFNLFHAKFSSVFKPAAIDIPTPSKEEVYRFRSELAAFLKPHTEALRNGDDASLIKAIKSLYLEKLKLDNRFESYFYDSVGSAIEVSNPYLIMIEIMKGAKPSKMTLPLDKISNQYLRALLQKGIFDYSIIFFQDFFIRQITPKTQDGFLFDEIEKLLKGSQFQQEFLVLMHEFACAETNRSYSSVYETLIGAQSVFNISEDLLRMDPNFRITRASLSQQKTSESQLRSRLLEMLSFSDKVVVVRQHAADFQAYVKSLNLDPAIHTFDKHVKALVLGHYREAVLFKTTSALADAILRQQSENDGIDLRDPVTLVRNLSVPKAHRDRPRLNPLQCIDDMKRLEAEMNVFRQDFTEALQNKEGLRRFLEKFFRIKSEAQIPFARYSGPLDPVEGRPSHFEDGLVRFDEFGNPIHHMPQMVLTRSAVSDQEGIGKKWEDLTVTELENAYVYLYTTYLNMFMNQWVHRPNSAIDEMSLDGFIHYVFGDVSLQYLKSLDPDEQQRLMAEMAFYILGSGRSLLLDFSLLENIPFLFQHGVDLKKCVHVIYPLPDIRNPLAKLYESMKNLLSDDCLSPSNFRKSWGILCNVESEPMHQLVDDSQGSTLLRMAYKFFLFAKQMEEYVTGIRLLDTHRINSETISTMSHEIMTLRTETQGLRFALNEALSISKTALAASEASERRIERKTQQLAKNIEREQKIQKELNALKKEKKNLDLELERLKQELVSAQANMKEVTPLQDRIRDLELQVLENEKVSSGKQKAIERLEAETRTRKQEKEDLEKSLREQQERHAVIADQKANLEMTIAELHMQLATQGEEVANLEGQLRSNQRSYEEREHLEATIGALSARLKVHEETSVIERESTRKALLSGVKEYKEIAEQLVDGALEKLETTTSSKQQTETLTDLGKRLALVELTGNYIPSGGVDAALQQAREYESKRKGENKTLKAENEQLKKQLAEAMAALQKSQGNER